MGKGRGAGLPAVLGVVFSVGVALGQGPASPAGEQYGPPGVSSEQPLLPHDPTLQRRAPPQVTPGGGLAFPPSVHGVWPAPPPAPGAPVPLAPFVLTPEQMLELDQVLGAWERRNREVKSFECIFTRFEYDYVFTQKGQPGKLRDQGILKYAAPDKGLYRVDGERSAEWTETAPGKVGWKKSAVPRDKQWICDGKAIFEYNHKDKRRVEHALPPELQGKSIAEGPLPFVFGTEAQKLKERYFLRITTPPDVRGEIWLEAYPRFQRDAADFRKVDVILKINGLLPDAIQIIEPNGKNREVYKFEDVVVNRPLRVFEGNPFKPSLPLGWRAEVARNGQ